VSIAIDQENPSLAYGQDLALGATGTYADGSTADVTSAVRWSSSSPGVVGASTGVAHGLSAGDFQIAAQLDGLKAQTNLSVYAIPPSAPRGVSGKGVAGSARIDWLAPDSDGGGAVDGYTATLTPGGQTCTAAAWWMGGDDSWCTISGVEDGVYTATVVAHNYAGSSPPSANSATFTVRGAVPSVTLTSPDSPTRSAVLSYGAAFDEPVDGLASSDFSITGTALGCVVGDPVGTADTYTVDVTGCSDGTVTLTLGADTVSDAANNLGPATSVEGSQVTVDRTAPSVPSLSTPTLDVGLALPGSTVPIRLNWTASNDSGSGLAPAPYRLERSLSGGAWSFMGGFTGLTAGPAASSSGTVRFRVRSIDKAGNESDWEYTPTLSARLIQQTSAAVKYGGVWATAKASAYSAGSTVYANISGRSATYTFTGRSMAIVTTKGPSRGKVKIYVNGVLVTTLELYRSAYQYRSIAWQKTWSVSGTRTVKLVVVGTARRPRVDLDAVIVLR
jgi:hypothetical protein